ncbi:hypothetical protein BD311DRAFT_396887 [Dichomitus squalens]|uniref:Uncharacterized protein n=1 Tax=Dichomitus squalens TaxID=114155 RepID=A0A4Q9N0C1_9APHY|nr:hypothetical protein BD311DRAFT_396887 [Dichomitus squalens]
MVRHRPYILVAMRRVPACNRLATLPKSKLEPKELEGGASPRSMSSRPQHRVKTACRTCSLPQLSTRLAGRPLLLRILFLGATVLVGCTNIAKVSLR